MVAEIEKKRLEEIRVISSGTWGCHRIRHLPTDIVYSIAPIRTFARRICVIAFAYEIEPVIKLNLSSFLYGIGSKIHHPKRRFTDFIKRAERVERMEEINTGSGNKKRIS
jgi:hypothetical protein